MATAFWKVPVRWRTPGLCDRTALYPALYLRWTGVGVGIAREPPAGRWAAADLRVMVTDGALTQDEQELMTRSEARGLPLILAPQSPLPPEDLAHAAAGGHPVIAWTDAGPLATPAPHRPGLGLLQMSGCAARPAEDLILLRELAMDAAPSSAPIRTGARQIIAAIESAAAFAEIWPALERHLAETGARLAITSESEPALFDAAGLSGAAMLDPADPVLTTLIAEAQAFLCVYPDASPDSPRPAQWARTALFLGAPVIAASHPTLDGLAHLMVLDDWERGLRLFSRFPLERMKAVVAGQAFMAARVEPERIAAEWTPLLAPPARRSRRPPPASAGARRPLLLVLIDIHQDLDVLLPVLLALQQREEVRLRIVVTDWLVSESPRILNLLAAHGLAYEVHPREAVRAGEAPSLGGVDGVLSGADTNTRAHKAGHALVGRARRRGAASFTLQHGFENIGLTYKDELHGEQIRFASEIIFTWGPKEALAPWTAPETRAAATPVGSPKTAPAPARALKLNQGFWTRTVGVFENLHWHRFDDAYRARVIAELERAAELRPDTLFIVKPHHAGRWMSCNRDRIGERANLVVTDPTDSAWEPHTAPAFIASVDQVLTTPSTVALDAARTGRPVAVLGYGLELPLYEPLPIVQRSEDLDAFLADEGDERLLRNEAFLARARLPGRADHRIAARIAAALRERAGAGRPRRLLAFSG
jgi:hypothetical protein